MPGALQVDMRTKNSRLFLGCTQKLLIDASKFTRAKPADARAFLRLEVITMEPKHT